MTAVTLIRKGDESYLVHKVIKLNGGPACAFCYYLEKRRPQMTPDRAHLTAVSVAREWVDFGSEVRMQTMP